MNSHDRRDFLRVTAGGLAASLITPALAFAHPAIRANAPVQIAVIGVGRQGRAILGELATIAECAVVAVCDSDDSRLQAALRRAQGVKGYASAAELFAKEAGVEAVVIATPTHLHRELVLEALKAGKHVFVETPLAHSLEDLQALSEASKRATKVVAAGFQGRANPIYSLARSFFKSGSLRDLATLRSQNNKKTAWRTPGSTPERDKELNWHLDPAQSLGLIGELGAHQFDVYHWFLGRHPVAARSRGSLRLHKDGREMPDTVACELVYDDGLVLDWSCTLANSYEGRYEMFGGSMAAIKLAWTHGWMFKEADAPTAGWEVYANRQQFHNDQGITLIADATKLAAQGKLQDGVGLPYTSLYYALADFVKAVAEKAAPACSLSDAARTTAVAIRANEALKSGGEVAIDPKLLEAL
jgi:predicted dehydrogenase